MTVGKSVSLSPAAIAWVEEAAKNHKRSFSATVEGIIKRDMSLSPLYKRQEEIRKLRETATILYLECGLPQEAIISWVRGVTGGFIQKEAPPKPPEEK